jgi:hypothetical protein
MKYLKTIWFAATLIMSIPLLRGQSTIAYFNGPAFQLPGIEGYANGIDFDGDKTFDSTFSSSEMICTADIPVSFCSQSYYISVAGSNTLLWQGGQILVMPAGNVIGNITAPNTVWGNPGQGGILTSFDSSPRDGTSEWTPPLQTLTNGYLGIRFYAADGGHYGWIHARLPDRSLGTNGFPAEFSPVIVDWAFETRVDTAIVAGGKPVPALQNAPEIIRAGYLRLNWQTETGKTYQIQSKDNLLLPFWTNLDFVIVATATNAMTDIPMTSGAKFYRIVEAN